MEEELAPTAGTENEACVAVLVLILDAGVEALVVVVTVENNGAVDVPIDREVGFAAGGVKIGAADEAAAFANTKDCRDEEEGVTNEKPEELVAEAEDTVEEDVVVGTGFEKAEAVDNEKPGEAEAEKGEASVEFAPELEANENAGDVEAEDEEEEEENRVEVENEEAAADDDNDENVVVPNWDELELGADIDAPKGDKPGVADEAAVPNKVEPEAEVPAVEVVVPNRSELGF